MTREEWLLLAAEKMRPWLEAVGATWPAKFRVSVGFPKGARKAIGQCWNTVCSADKAAEIFVHPALEKLEPVLSTLLHELVHACVGVEHGHRKPFIKVAKALGFNAPWKSTPASPELSAKLLELGKSLPPFPHAALADLQKEKKQGTRMLLVSCAMCGCKVRMTQKWLDTAGAPACGCGAGDMVIS